MKSWLFKWINKINEPLAKLTKRRKENTHVNAIRSKKDKITTGVAKIQRIISMYFKNMNYNKLKNLADIDRFLDTNELPELNWENMKTPKIW